MKRYEQLAELLATDIRSGQRALPANACHSGSGCLCIGEEIHDHTPAGQHAVEGIGGKGGIIEVDIRHAWIGGPGSNGS